MAPRPREKVELHLPGGAVGIRHARCPQGCDLMDDAVAIHGLPSIRIRYRTGDREGIVNLDPLYGRFENVQDWQPPAGTIVEFSCPACGLSLRSEEGTCQTCAAPLFSLQLPSATVEGCLRVGCHYHRLSIVDDGALMERLFSRNNLDSYL